MEAGLDLRGHSISKDLRSRKVLDLDFPKRLERDGFNVKANKAHAHAGESGRLLCGLQAGSGAHRFTFAAHGSPHRSENRSSSRKRWRDVCHRTPGAESDLASLSKVVTHSLHPAIVQPATIASLAFNLK